MIKIANHFNAVLYFHTSPARSDLDFLKNSGIKDLRRKYYFPKLSF